MLNNFQEKSKNLPECVSILKDEILNIPGIKYTTNGYINDIIRLIKESLIR